MTETSLDPRLSRGDVDDEVFHYVRKDEIVESAVTGRIVTALCGVSFPVTKTPKPGSPVCQTCKELHSLLG